MAYRFPPFPMTLGEHQGHLPLASDFKYDFFRIVLQ